MTTLVIRQQRMDGATKVWKLKADDGAKSFGSSRLADIISISPETKGIEGTFEFRNHQWWYTDLSKDFDSGGQSKSLAIDRELNLKHKGHEIQLIPIQTETELYRHFESGNLGESKENAKLFQLFVVKRNGKIVEHSILPFGIKFVSKFFENRSQSITPIQSKDWYSENWGDLTIQQKSLSLSKHEDLSKVSLNQFMDRESRLGLRIMGGCTLCVLLISFLMPKPDHTQEDAQQLPQPPRSIVLKTTVKPPRKKETVRQVAQQAPSPPPSAKALDSTKSSASKGSSLLKNFTQGRISQLISKVSAQAARSANIVVGSGIKAGSAPSGAALSALGNVDHAGRDWSKDAKGSDVKISTGGRGGGNSTAGLGGLSKGGIGSAGVGLIEDESEITGGLDREVIAQYIKSQLGQILYCYERQLSAHPELFGKVAVRFTIGPIGGVENQSISDTTLKNATVEGCILKKVAAWKFPAPQGGTKVMVTYPFLFKSTN